MLPETASSLELWWTGLALPGMILSVWNVWGAACDLKLHWRTSLWGLGWIGLGKVGIVLLLGIIMVVVGVIAMLTPPPLLPENIEAGMRLAGLFMAIDVLILGLAVLFFIERRWVEDDLPFLRRVRERRQQRRSA